jgi:hypothetical protein
VMASVCFHYCKISSVTQILFPCLYDISFCKDRALVPRFCKRCAKGPHTNHLLVDFQNGRKTNKPSCPLELTKTRHVVSLLELEQLPPSQIKTTTRLLALASCSTIMSDVLLSRICLRRLARIITPIPRGRSTFVSSTTSDDSLLSCTALGVSLEPSQLLPPFLPSLDQHEPRSTGNANLLHGTCSSFSSCQPT